MASQSTPGVEYSITCTLESRADGIYISMACNCPASAYHEIVCKHEKAVLDGEVSMLADPKDSQLLARTANFFLHTPFKAHYDEFEKKMAVLQKEEKRIKDEIGKQKRKAKDEIGSKLAGGILIANKP
jgi:hypothetical protein